MFYFLFILKPRDELFLVVVLCEQLKLQAFQAIKKLKRQHLARPKTDQTTFAEQITIHGCYLSNKKTYFYSCFSPLKSLYSLLLALVKAGKLKNPLQL